MSDALQAAARPLGDGATELRLAADHCDVAARHFRDELVPRGAAHAWAARGHVLKAEALLDEQARDHAERSDQQPG